MRIKKIGVGSAATMGGLVYAAVGVIYATFMLVISVGINMLSGEDWVSLGWTHLFLMTVPVITGLLGAFIAGAMSALYNLLAPKVGGVLIEVE